MNKIQSQNCPLSGKVFHIKDEILKKTNLIQLFVKNGCLQARKTGLTTVHFDWKCKGNFVFDIVT